MNFSKLLEQVVADAINFRNADEAKRAGRGLEAEGLREALSKVLFEGLISDRDDAALIPSNHLRKALIAARAALEPKP